jgi:multiple antibiotic resistance protein
MFIDALMPFFQFTLQAAVMLLAITNPFYVVPSFIAMTHEYDDEETRAIARKTVRNAFWILLFFLISGELVFYVFGITIGAFQVAGGILLLLIGLSMIFETSQAGLSKRAALEADASARDDITLVPLAIPMLSGPGTITTVLVLKSSAAAWWYMVGIFIALLVALWLVYLVYTRSKRINRALGRMGTQAVTKIMGLILLAVSVQFVANGAVAIWKDFGFS